MLLAFADTIVSPSAGLIAWTIAMVFALVAGAVTAAKGRWGWVLIGVLTGGFLWLITAFLAPSPDSFWARRARRAASS